MKLRKLSALAVIAMLITTVLVPAVGSLDNSSFNESYASDSNTNETDLCSNDTDTNTSDVESPTNVTPLPNNTTNQTCAWNDTDDSVNESVDVVFDSMSKPDSNSKPVIIMFKDKSDTNLIKQHGGKIKSAYRLKPALAASLPQKAIDNLRNNPGIEFVVDDLQIFTMGETLDWGVDRIDADVVHEYNNGAGVKVAIMDTGIDYNHPDLAANYKGGYDFGGDFSGAPNDSDPMDFNGHGTHCAGIVAAVKGNEIGFIGVAPETDLYAVKVFSDDGYGSYSDVIEALEFCIDTRTDSDPDNDLQVISMSFGSEYSAGDPGIESWINAAFDAEILLVGAAGNEGNVAGLGDNAIYPARYESVIAVAATDSSDDRASFSSTGPDVELAAPGVSIYSTYLGDVYAAMSGTSMACPHITGTAALVWDAYPGYTNTEVRQRLQETVEDLGAHGKDNEFGYGLVDAEKAAVDTTPPASVKDLKSSAVGGTWINWTWNDPADADFSHVIVNLNGVHETNVSKGHRFYNVTSLEPDTSYEIATQTVDTAENINETLVNQMVETNGEGGILPQGAGDPTYPPTPTAENNSEVSTGEKSYTMLKTLTITKSGENWLKTEHEIKSDAPGRTAYVKVMSSSDNAIYCENSTTNTVYTTFYCELDISSLPDGSQTFELQMMRDGGQPYTVYNKNWKLYLEEIPPKTNATSANTTAVGVNDIICVNHTVTKGTYDIDSTWVEVTYPNGTSANITTSNTSGVCGAGGTVYGVEINVGSTTGNLTVNTSWVNDTQGTIDCEDTFPNIIVSVKDLKAPQWSNPNTNKTRIYQNDYVKFTANWTDDVALAGYIFSTNQTGYWMNSSFVSFSGTSNTSESTTQITAPAGTTVQWRFYANDTSDNWNVTEIQSFVVSSLAPPPSSPYMIYGWVNYSNGSACDNPVNITNTNTSTHWLAETHPGYNFYQCILDTANISEGNVLSFNATDGTQFNVTNHTVTQSEINNGGLFNFNLTLPSLITEGPTVDSITIMPDNSGETGVQINPTPCSNKTVNISTEVSDPNGWDDIDTVVATVTGPYIVADSPVPLTFASNSTLTTATFNGTFNMSFYYLNGTYTVNVTATDKGSTSSSNSTYFDYQTLRAMELDTNTINFSISGPIEPGATRDVPGDEDMSTLNNATVRNTGNVEIDMEISGTNMTYGSNEITKENIETQIDILGYQNMSDARCFDVNMLIGELSLENADFKLFVPYGTSQGGYSGTITLTVTTC